MLYYSITITITIYSGSNICGDCHRRKYIIPSIHSTKETQVCETCYFVNAGKNKQQQSQHNIPTLQTQQALVDTGSLPHIISSDL